MNSNKNSSLKQVEKLRLQYKLGNENMKKSI